MNSLFLKEIVFISQINSLRTAIKKNKITKFIKMKIKLTIYTNRRQIMFLHREIIYLNTNNLVTYSKLKNCLLKMF